MRHPLTQVSRLDVRRHGLHAQALMGARRIAVPPGLPPIGPDDAECYAGCARGKLGADEFSTRRSRPGQEVCIC